MVSATLSATVIAACLHAGPTLRVAAATTSPIVEYTVPDLGASVVGGLSGGREPHVIIGGDGRVWFTEPKAGKLGAITPSGAVTEVDAASSTTRTIASVENGTSRFNGDPPANGLAIGPDGAIWVAMRQPMRGSFLSRVTSDGTVTQFELSGGVEAGAGPDLTTASGTLWLDGTGGTVFGVTPESNPSAPEGAGVMVPDASSGKLDTISVMATAPDQTLWLGGQATAVQTAASTTNPVTGSIAGALAHRGTDGTVTVYPIPEDPGDIQQFLFGSDLVGSNSGVTQTAVQDIAFGADGTVWFTYDVLTPQASAWEWRIGKITAAGTLVPTVMVGGEARVDGNDLPYPNYLTVGPDGSIWSTDGKRNVLWRLDPCGTRSELDVPTAGSTPGSITVGPDHNLWFLENSANKVGKVVLAQVPVSPCATAQHTAAHVVAPAAIEDGAAAIDAPFSATAVWREGSRRW